MISENNECHIEIKIRETKFDCFGCNYGIHKAEKEYIIHGELESTMLDFLFIPSIPQPLLILVQPYNYFSA